MKIAVLGDGTWGTAISNLIANNGFDVKLWCYNLDIYKSINEKSINDIYFPNYKLNPNIKAEIDLNLVLSNSDIVFEAIPIQFLNDVINKIKVDKIPNYWVILSKGLDNNLLKYPYQIIENFDSKISIALLLGASFAVGLINNNPTGFVIASNNYNLIKLLYKIVKNPFVKLYIQNDIEALSICSAMKNIIAIGSGIIDALNYQENSKILFIIEAINDIKKLLKSINADFEILYSIAGIGDIFLTALSSNSKNFRFGQSLVFEREFETKHIAEGLNTLLSIKQIEKKYDVNLPIFSKIFDIVYLKANALELIELITK